MSSKKFINYKNALLNTNDQNESSQCEYAGSLIEYSSKGSLNYIKSYQIDSCRTRQVNGQSYGQTDQFICLKIMSVLIVLFVIGLVFSRTVSSLKLADNLSSVNSVHNTSERLVTEKYSPNSKLFYDLSLTDRAIKPIYFQFIANKSPPLHQLNHHSSFLKSQLHKHANNRHLSRPLVNHQNYLQKYILNNSTAYCNDGTNASYYFRRGKNSKWIIFLEGGWYCYSKLSCYQRWLQMRNYMTSGHWPERKFINGILSSKKEENTFYYNANHVYIGYCSSDGWSGDRPAKSSKDLHFSGSRIIENVIEDLVEKGLKSASLVMMSGSSAGASGVLINLDRIADLIYSINRKTKVLGLIDSGWFLDNVPFKNFNNLMAGKIDDMCLEGQLCSPIESIKKGFKYWNAKIPKSCENMYPDEPWRCFFGHRLMPTLKTPIFVMQFLFDEAQMTADNVAMPTTKAHWQYVHKMGLQMRSSLKNVSGLYSPSCISHTMLIKRNWNQMKINRVTLQEAIKCWELLQMNIDRKSGLPNSLQRRRLQSNAMTNDVDVISPSLHSNNYHYKDAYSNVFNFRETNSIFSRLFSKVEVKKKAKRNRIKKSNNNRISEQCSVRLIDDCAFPQCNSQCPSLRNIFTGKEINFFDLLKAFGVNTG